MSPNPLLYVDDQDGRRVSSPANAYLRLIRRKYLDGFFQEFDDKLRDVAVASSR